MRILFVSNAGWSHQGYGVQVQGLLPHLLEQGHDIAVFAFWGLEGGKVQLPLGGDDGPVLWHYPRFADPYGNDAVAGHARDWGADCVITLMDAWVCDPNAYQGLNWLAWLPIDQTPIPEPVLARLPHMTRALPYSRFGEQLVKATGVPCSYVPHGCDTNVFRPFAAAGRVQAKASLGFDADAFVVGMVGANKGFPARKAFPEAFRAFAKLREAVPRARLYVHSLISSAYGGPNLQQLAELCGIADYVAFADQYLLGVGYPTEGMAIAYNGMDVLLQASTHEGFGLPLIEAQACGTPVVANDCTSMPELVCPVYGELVPPLQPQLTTLMSWAETPSIAGLAAALGRIEARPISPTDRSLVRLFAEGYSWKTVADHYWKPVLDHLAEGLGAPSSKDRVLHQALRNAIVLEEREPGEGDTHDCCCEHVIDELSAMPGPEEEILGVAKGHLANCGHNALFLEEFVTSLQAKLREDEEAMR